MSPGDIPWCDVETKKRACSLVMREGVVAEFFQYTVEFESVLV